MIQAASQSALSTASHDVDSAPRDSLSKNSAIRFSAYYKANAAPAQAKSVDVQIHHFTHLDLCVRLRGIFAKYSGCLLCDLLQWHEITLPYLHSSSSVAEFVFRSLCGLGA